MLWQRSAQVLIAKGAVQKREGPRRGLCAAARTSAKFSCRRSEVDLGYGICLLLEELGVLEIRRDTLIPSRAAPDAVRARGPAVESAQAA